jgi:hypothetical protein
LDFHEKLIEIFTTSIFYLKLKENNTNDMGHMLFGLFCVPADGWTKLAQQLKTMVLLYFSCFIS